MKSQYTPISYKKSFSKFSKGIAHIILIDSKSKLPKDLEKEETSYAKDGFKNGNKVVFNCFGAIKVLLHESEKDEGRRAESLRVAANALLGTLQTDKISTIEISASKTQDALSLAEGFALSNYQFLKYFSDKDKRASSIKNIHVCAGSKKEVDALSNVVEAVCHARDLVNEPVSYLTSPQLGLEIKSLAKKFGFKAEVWGMKKIQTMKMGGLLAVNKGSVDEPSFSIMEWKPTKPKNKQAIVLVGKGVVYDTGGLSLKPTANSMDMMKSDMGGAAAIIGAMCAIAANKLNVHVIGLVPSTDNRPGKNAYAPGDVITMYDGSTVEVLNTDAEGRMILADALSYAKKYKPELVIDAATLTGAAARAIGKHAIVGMGNAKKSEMSALQEAGSKVGEPIVEFPFWDVYADDLKSKIADQKNLGGPEAGAITAGKFLEKFTDYPYIHLDIAGPAFMLAPFNYRGVGGTGVGVRVLYNFLSAK